MDFQGDRWRRRGGLRSVSGGAAGSEVDRYDLMHGTPPHARILASSEPFSDNYVLVQEEIMFSTPGLGGTENPWVRADLVYFTTPNDGAVFSTGSIAWSAALSWNNYNNSVSVLTKNILDAFVGPGALPGKDYDA
ncbi:N,N-dimethylformamidase beta subunit family domain-containing protein (plasmid) [Mesorhizobium sp. ORM8.1]